MLECLLQDIHPEKSPLFCAHIIGELLNLVTMVVKMSPDIYKHDITNRHNSLTIILHPNRNFLSRVSIKNKYIKAKCYNLK